MKQGNREKLSVTVSPHLYEVVERYAERAKVTKSKVVEEAIRLWERSRQAAVAREGYQREGGPCRRGGVSSRPGRDRGGVGGAPPRGSSWGSRARSFSVRDRLQKGQDPAN